MAAEFEIGALSGTRTFNEFVGNTDPKDFYRFTLGSPNDFNLVLSGISQNASAGVTLYQDENNNGEADSGEGITSKSGNSTLEASIFGPLNPGTYLVEVNNSYSNDTRYTLSLSATPSAGDTAGNTWQEGRDMGLLSGFSSFNEFLGDLDNNDYYRFSLDSVTEFNLSLSGLTDSASVELYVGLNNNGQIERGNSITSSSGYSNSEALLKRTLGPGTYFLKVSTGYSESNTGYPLTLSVLEDSPILPTEQLNFFGGLVFSATANAARGEILTLILGNDTTQLASDTMNQYAGGVLALEGNDSVTGSDANDIIYGNAGPDVLTGNAGSDMIQGGKAIWVLRRSLAEMGRIRLS